LMLVAGVALLVTIFIDKEQVTQIFIRCLWNLSCNYDKMSMKQV
jgi:hypothetical protein